MGEIIDYICCFFCNEKLEPYIEIIELIFSIIEIIFLIWGIVDIPWKDIRKGGKIFYFIMFIFIVITFIIIVILIFLRCCNKINTNKNHIGIHLCITSIILAILSKIIFLIAELIIIHDMYYKDDNGEDIKYSNRQLAAVIISFIVTELALAFHIYCSCFLLKLKLAINSNSNYPPNKPNYIHYPNNSDLNGNNVPIYESEKSLDINQNNRVISENKYPPNNNTTILPFENSDNNKNIFEQNN